MQVLLPEIGIKIVVPPVFFFLVFIILNLSPAISEATPHTITIQKVKGEPGETVSVEVVASGIDMAGFSLIINYDSQYLTPKDAQRHIVEGAFQYFPEYAPNKISVAWFNMTAVNVKKMFKVEFEIKDTITDISELFIDKNDINNEVLDEDTKGIEVSYIPGGVSDIGEGCYIATAIYGSYNAPEVLVLRRFRDEVLKETLPGRLFIKAYYALSPQVTDYLAEAGQLNGWVRSALDWLVERLDSSK